MRKTLSSVLLVGALSFGGCDGAQVKEVRDMTGDSIPDIRLYVSSFQGQIQGDFLFIGQKDGSYERVRLENDGTTFEKKGRILYFFDGEFYRISAIPK